MQSCYRGKTVIIDLIVLDMCNFDVIFGMNWMSMHRVSIHYKKKKILFTMECEIVIFEEEKSRSLPRVIFTFQALRSVRKGCQSFLASVVDLCEAIPLFFNVKIIWEFQHVFLEDLLGLPPD